MCQCNLQWTVLMGYADYADGCVLGLLLQGAVSVRAARNNMYVNLQVRRARITVGVGAWWNGSHPWV